MKETTNYKLKLPEDADIIEVSDLSGNFELIDRLLGVLSTANKFIRGTEDLKVCCTDIIAGVDGPFTFESAEPTEEGGNYYSGTINIAFKLFLDGAQELSGYNNWDFKVYPAGKEGKQSDLTGIMLPIHLCYDVISKKLTFETSADYLATDTGVTSEGNMLRIPIGIMNIDISNNELAVNLDETEFYEEITESGIYIPGFFAEEVSE